MIDFILAGENLPFTIALGLMFAIGLLEGVTTLLGMGASDLIDSLVPDLDADVDLGMDAHGDGGLPPSDLHQVGSPSALSRIFGWLNAGRVPILILFIIFLAGFGLVGLFIQSLASQTLGRLLPGLLASVPAFLGSLYLARLSSKGLARILPKDETEAVSEKSFIGRLAVITLGTASQGSPAQAKLVDAHGLTHYVMVEPDNPEDRFPTGEHVLLVTRKGAVFAAIPNPSATLLNGE